MKTEHIDEKFHFISKVLKDKRIDLVKIYIDRNPTNLLTKSLSSKRFALCKELMWTLREAMSKIQ